MKNLLTIVFIFLMLLSFGGIVRSSLAGRQNMIVSNGGEPPLPEGVVAVEWLESDGNQNVTIGTIYGADIVSVMAEAEDIPSQGTRKLCGIGWNANGQDDVGITINGWNNSSSVPCIVGNWYEVVFDRNDTAYGSILVNLGRVGNCKSFFFDNGADKGKIFVLFCGSRGTGPYKSSSGNYMPWIGRIGRVRISGGGETIRDLIPVRVGEGEEAEGFFYDLVSGEFFGNGGTGKLVFGNDL